MASARDERFAIDTKLSDPWLGVCDSVGDVHFAYLAAAYPQFKAQRAESLLVAQAEQELCSVEEDELLGWSRCHIAARDAANSVADALPHPKHIEMLRPGRRVGWVVHA